MFAVAVLLALLRLGGFSGANPLYLKMLPTTPVAKAAKPAAGEISQDEALDLPNADGPAFGPVRRLLTITSVVSSLPSGEEIVRSEKLPPDEAPVFYRPSSGEDRGTDGEPVCGNLGEDQKNTSEPPRRGENRKGESAAKTSSATARSQPVPDEKVASKSSTSKKDSEKTSETTEPKDRKSSAKEISQETRDG